MISSRYNSITQIGRIGFLGILAVLFLGSCEDFINPEQNLIIEASDHYDTWYEYRASEMGLYALQQDLVDQIIILGELRGDLLKTTQNASPDLLEVNNFNISKENQYASPYGFYRLIAACNSLIRQLKFDHPEVTDPEETAISNYDRLYGEALCMRAWAYFNAVRIYGKVPYLYESLTSIEEIEEYVTTGQIIDDIDYIYGADGAISDTVVNDTVSLNRRFVNLETVIDTFTYQLENDLKAVGVNHSQINGDITWKATIWTEYSLYCLLGEMYLYDQNYLKAQEYFDHILYQNQLEEEARFKMDSRFRRDNWKNIFSDIDINEHIYTVWFDRSFEQTNSLQQMFSPFSKNQFMMQPTQFAIQGWESIWDEMIIDEENDRINDIGVPGDYYRGHGVSYVYYNGNTIMSNNELAGLLEDKIVQNTFRVNQVMSNYDTAVYKYSIGKGSLDFDANYTVYRAADIHLYKAEIFARWKATGVSIYFGQSILNDGSDFGDDAQLGVRGRVDFGDGDDGVDIGKTTYYIHDPYTNAIDSIIELSGKSHERSIILVNEIMDERARELAFEGKRFYDLMRIAKRREDPAYLADKIAAKFSGTKREYIREYLMEEENWYINYFE